MTGICGCDNHIIEETSNSEIQQENMLQGKLDQPEFDDFVNAFENFAIKMQEINSRKKPEDLQELANLYSLCKEQPEEYLVILEANINSIYTNNEMGIIKKLFSDMEKSGESLTKLPDFSVLSESDKNELNHVLAMKMPQVQLKINLLEQPNMLKSRAENNDCSQRCKDSYYYDLLGIASGALCAGGAAIVVSCASLGTLSIPALIGAISTVGVASVSIDIATANYEICLKGC